MDKLYANSKYPGYLRLYLSICFLTALSGCASLSNREKVLLGATAGIVVGGTIGLLTTPNDGTSKLGHSALWAGVGGVAAGTAGLFIFDVQKRSSELERDIAQFKKELLSCPQRTLVGEYDVNTSKPLPEHLRQFVKPEKVREFAIDLWIDKSDSEENQSQYHCDKEVEYEPGAFRRLRNSGLLELNKSKK